MRRLLEAGGDVDRVTGGEPLLGPGDDLAGVDADPELEARPVVALEVVVQPGEPRSQVGRGPGRAERVVLVQHRNAEHGHHGVADELLDRAAVPLDHAAGQLEIARHHRPKGLRVELLAERRRAGDVAEEHGHRLALLPACFRSGERYAAGLAEAGSGPVLVAAGGAVGHAPSLEAAA